MTMTDPTLGPDPSFEEVYASLSAPPDVDGLSRRRFLQGALAVGGGVALAGPLSKAFAAAAAPLGPTDGVLVVVQLGGGNDGLNTLIPTGDAGYRSLRPMTAIGDAVPIAPGFGLHPALGALSWLYAAGNVAVVRGVGAPERDHSHFSSMATWMAGTAGTDRRTGWLGRWLDTLPDADQGLRGMSIGSAIPLHLVGNRSQVTSLPLSDAPLGANRTDLWESTVIDAVDSFAGAATGKGRWADLIATADQSAMRRARDVGALYPQGVDAPTGQVTSQLYMAAKLINLDVGAQVITVNLSSFDTHDYQLGMHKYLLGDLDRGISTLFGTLDAKWKSRVTLMTFSEFGRRPQENAGVGTDHGTSSVAFVVGDQVKGGLYGRQPSCTNLDSRGDLEVTTDYRSLYASVLTGALKGDSQAVLGGSFPDLGLFEPTAPPPPPPVDIRFAPFASAKALVEQQYADLLGRFPDAPGVTYWTRLLTAGTVSPASLVARFLGSPEFGSVIRPSVRLAVTGLGGAPAFTDLMAWAGRLRAGGTLQDVAREVVTKPAYQMRFGSLSGADLVTAVHYTATAQAPSSTFVGQWSSAEHHDVLAAAAQLPAAVMFQRPPVDVLMTYAGMLRRGPDAAGYAYWTDRVRRGTSINRLSAEFLASSEYAGRFR